MLSFMYISTYIHICLMCINYLHAYISRVHTVCTCIDIPLHIIALKNSKCVVSSRNVYM